MKGRGLGRLRRIAAGIRNSFSRRAVLLLYHRVAEPVLDPQLLCVSRRHFAEHIEVIRRYGGAIQIKQIGQAWERGRGTVIGITFDDGYADNLHNAYPVLKRYDTPATVFVTAGYIGSRREFWYDALEKILLSGRSLPETLGLEVAGSSFQWRFGPDPAQLSDWSVARPDDPTARHAAYRSLCDLLRPLRDAQRQGILERIGDWAGVGLEARCSHRALSPEELRALAADGLVEIGSHTITHPLLSALPAAEQRSEIAGSKTQLEQLVGQEVSSFAYPFGGRAHYNTESVSAVREAGFVRACSNFPGVARRGTDPWQLPRFLVRDWDGDQFARALESWLHE
jgi:peptidoglycan/xylan/chitin deacetylase (PgdA/CDA1 family)